MLRLQRVRKVERVEKQPRPLIKRPRDLVVEAVAAARAQQVAIRAHGRRRRDVEQQNARVLGRKHCPHGRVLPLKLAPVEWEAQRRVIPLQGRVHARAARVSRWRCPHKDEGVTSVRSQVCERSPQLAQQQPVRLKVGAPIEHDNAERSAFSDPLLLPEVGFQLEPPPEVDAQPVRAPPQQAHALTAPAAGPADHVAAAGAGAEAAASTRGAHARRREILERLMELATHAVANSKH